MKPTTSNNLPSPDSRTTTGGLGKRFWVSWYAHTEAFELHTPWWRSGWRDETPIICAALKAYSPAHARLIVLMAHDDPSGVEAGGGIEWRFVEERPASWSPFTDRFRRAVWMKWEVDDDNQALAEQIVKRMTDPDFAMSLLPVLIDRLDDNTARELLLLVAGLATENGWYDEYLRWLETVGRWTELAGGIDDAGR